MMQNSVEKDDLPAREGDIIAGKYRVEALIARGGMGVVFSAIHEELQDRVAIKLIYPSRSTDPEFSRRFLREARLAVKIKSDNIVRVLDLGRFNGDQLYMVMEHLEGQDLSTMLAERGPLPIEDAVEYVFQACSAVAAAHALGVVHRDLKPANLFLTTTPDGLSPLVKVLDFGISKLMSFEASDATMSLTAPDIILGSLKYMSPEQIRSTSEVDQRADVWSLGVLLYELLSRKRPFAAKDPMGMIAAICSDDPRPLRPERPDAPAELEAIILRCLQKDPEQRMQSATDLAKAIAPFRAPAGRGSSQPSSSINVGSGPRRSSVLPMAGGESTSESSDSSDSGRSQQVSTTGATHMALTSAPSRVSPRIPLIIAAVVAVAALLGGTVAFLIVGAWAIPPQGPSVASPQTTPATIESGAAREPSPLATPTSTASNAPEVVSSASVAVEAAPTASQTAAPVASTAQPKRVAPPARGTAALPPKASAPNGSPSPATTTAPVEKPQPEVDSRH